VKPESCRPGGSLRTIGSRLFLFRRQGVARDDAQALTWYRKAAEQGYPLAQQALGWMYSNGRGVQRDYAQAASWYEKAATPGDAVAESSLGYMYGYGVGVERDWIGSLRWYRMAAAQGDPDAIQFLKSLKPTTRMRYLDLGLGAITLIAGSIFLLAGWEFLLPVKKFRSWQQVFVGILGIIFVVYAGMCLYSSAHVIRYLPLSRNFHLIRRVLFAAAVIVTIPVLLPAKKGSSQPSSAQVIR